MTRVSSATVKGMRGRSMQENINAIRSGKLNTEQLEAMRRFYPQAFAAANRTGGKFGGSSNKDGDTGNKVRAAAERRIKAPKPGVGKRPKKNLEERAGDKALKVDEFFGTGPYKGKLGKASTKRKSPFRRQENE